MKLRLFDCVLKNIGKEILTLSWLSVENGVKFPWILYQLFIILKLWILLWVNLLEWKVKLEWLHRINNSLQQLYFI
jgi:hypothetical protein